MESIGSRYFKKGSGSDNNMYEHLEIAGSYLNRNGVFHFIKNGANVITHRLFEVN